MLRNLSDCALSTRILIIEDLEVTGGQELFLACLKNHAENDTVKKLNLICYENSPQFYLSAVRKSSQKIILHNFFKDPCGWNNESAEISDLNHFISRFQELSEAVIFIDSLSVLTQYYGFNSVCKSLYYLKNVAKKVICLVHGDVMSMFHLNDFKSLSTAFIKFQSSSSISFHSKEKVVDVLYKKSSGKIISQEEIMVINEDLKVSSSVKNETKPLKSPNAKSKIRNLTTFKLGIELNENERRAKNQLTLPYIRTEQNSGGEGEIIYYPDAEDDPDDDLDI